MKRFLAAFVLAALTLVSIATSAFAVANNAPHGDYVDLRFRTHSNTYTQATIGAFSDLAGNAYDAVDSTITTRLGAQTMVLDTTTAVSTYAWWHVTHPAFVVADSNHVYCTLSVSDAGASSSTADSIYVMAQASFDGVNWFNLATFLGGTPGTATSRLDQTNATGTFFGALNRLGASGGTPSWSIYYKQRVPLGAASDQNGLWRYPMLRWIVGFPDAVKYNVRARVHFTTTEVE